MSYAQQIQELKERRRRLVEVDARGIHKKATEEKRELTSEETANFNRAIDDAEKLATQIEGLERAERQENLLKTVEPRRTSPDPVNPDPQARATEQQRSLEQATDGLPQIYRDAFKRVYGESHRSSDAYHQAFRNHISLTDGEKRAHQADVDISGGYAKAPPAFVAGLIKAVDDEVFIRRLATRHPVTGSDSLGAVSLDGDPDDGTWTAEIAAVTETADMAFGKRELKPYPLSKLAKLSRKLIRVAAINVEALLTARLTYKFALTEEKAFLTGNGAGRPLGVFTASNDGVPTSRDVSTGNTTTAIKFDGLKEAKYTLKSQYWARAAWCFHRDAIKQLAKEKDGEGRYIWEASVRGGEPDRLLSFPFYVSEHAPATFTTGLYVGMLADWSKYWIADGLDFEVQRLVELYAANNQIGFIGRAEIDAMPVLAEAFVRVKLA